MRKGLKGLQIASLLSESRGFLLCLYTRPRCMQVFARGPHTTLERERGLDGSARPTHSPPNVIFLICGAIMLKTISTHFPMPTSTPSHSTPSRIQMLLLLLLLIELKSSTIPERVSYGTAGGINVVDVRYALDCGFSSFDTAMAEEWYDEDAVALALAERVPRAEVFVTSKVHPRDLGYSLTRAAGERSAAKFGGYVDVLLLHYSHCWGDLCAHSGNRGGTWRESWRAVEDLRVEGKVRYAGVSNFSPAELLELAKLAGDGGGEIRVVQDWCDPFHQAKEQVRVSCEERRS